MSIKTDMDVRSELNEFLQNRLHETPNVELEWTYDRDLRKYTVKLYIVAQEWVSDPGDSIMEAKNQVMRKALDELKSLDTERSLRVRLQMAMVCRNEHLEAIRAAVKGLKKLFKDNETRHLLPMVGKIYAIMDQLETHMQKPPFCIWPPRGSAAWNRIYGLAPPQEASDMDLIEEDTGELLAGAVLGN